MSQFWTTPSREETTPQAYRLQFNAIRIGLEGKIDSIKQRRPDLIVEAQAKIKKAAKVIAKLTAKKTARAS